MCVRDSVCACMRMLKLPACVYSLHLCRLTETGQSDRAPSTSVIARTFRTAWTADDDDDAVLSTPPPPPTTPTTSTPQSFSTPSSHHSSSLSLASLHCRFCWVGLQKVSLQLRGLGACMTLKTFATWFELGFGQVAVSEAGYSGGAVCSPTM